METKKPEGVTLKPNTVFAIKSYFGLNQNSNFPKEEREICINALKNNRNNRQNSRKKADSQTTAATQDIQTLNNPNLIRTRRRRRILSQSNASSASKQVIFKWNAEKENQ